MKVRNNKSMLGRNSSSVGSREFVMLNKDWRYRTRLISVMLRLSRKIVFQGAPPSLSNRTSEIPLTEEFGWLAKHLRFREPLTDAPFQFACRGGDCFCG